MDILLFFLIGCCAGALFTFICMMPDHPRSSRMDLTAINKTLQAMARRSGDHLVLSMQDVHRATPAGTTADSLIEHMLAHGWERTIVGSSFFMENPDGA